MADSGDGRLIVYQTKTADMWAGSSPLLDRRGYFQRLGFFPPYRWNDQSQDALYTSHDADVSWDEVAQHHRSSSLAATDLADTNDRVVLATARFRALPSISVYDGRTEGFLSRPDIGALMACGRDGGHIAGRTFATPLTTGARRVTRLVVPSAPFFRIGDHRWNSVFYIGDRAIPESALPGTSEMTIVRRGHA